MSNHRTSDRVRFNWGFHDATLDAQDGRRNRMYITPPSPTGYPLPQGDEWQAYRLGYIAGQAHYATHGKRGSSSEPAWQEHLATASV